MESNQSQNSQNLKFAQILKWNFHFNICANQAFCPSSYFSQLASCKLSFVFTLSDQSRQTTCKQISACNLQADKNTRPDKMPEWNKNMKFILCCYITLLHDIQYI